MKNIVCYDVETTGLSVKNDYIIQLAAVKLDGETFAIIEERNWYVKPIHNYIIDPSAEETHHLTKEFIEEHGRPMSEVGPEFLMFTKDCDLLSYNGNRFDIKILYKDLQLVGLELPMDRMFYDAYAMDVRFNPRNLSTLYKRYTGKELADAHDALADVRATIEVFRGQVRENDLTRTDIDSFEENQLLTPDGSIRNTAAAGQEPNYVFGFGKYKDSEFMKICETDPLYIKWFMGNIASAYTAQKLRIYYRSKKIAKKS